MKAVIVDASGSVAVALRDDGQFVKLKNLEFSIGQEIRIAPTRVTRFPKQAAIAASCALVLTGGAGYGLYEWNSPYSYVSLDASPSIEYALNRFDVVIAVNGLNEEGQHVADTIVDSVKNTKIDKALEITVATLSDENYISTSDTSNVVVAVYSDSDSKAVELVSTVNKVTNTTPDNVAVAAVAVDKNTHDQIEAGIKVDVSATEKTDEIAIAKEETSADKSDVSPAKNDANSNISADSGDVNDNTAVSSVDTQKDTGTKGNGTAGGDKNTVTSTSNGAVEKTDNKTATDSQTNKTEDKKNNNTSTNSNNKNNTSDNSSNKNNESSNKTEAPSKTEDSPVKGDVAPPRAEQQEVVIDNEIDDSAEDNSDLAEI